ncbi:hypothetical protein [Pseudomonas petrae]|uniref:hypothetical protein n=1 Tax=Pseudomonas petrae TaxID=2912190 RepID=UPI001F16ACAA|nr:hypothetical protein [Pseudomonas petrae]MCF7557780.1 hypothetical protein [Pseudomonas petrae]
MQTNKITLVLRPHAGTKIEELQRYAKPGMPVGVGRALGFIASAGEGDVMERAEQLESQVVIAEAAMRRGTVMHDQDHLPALRRVIAHVPAMYLQVADAIKQAALDDGDDESMAGEAAGQAIRVLVMFKQRLEMLLEPDLLTPPPQANPITEKPVIAETPYAQVRVTDIGEWIRTVTNAKRYEWLRDKNRVEDMDTDLCAAREEQCFFGAELDAEVDTGMRLERLLEKHGEPV